MKDKKIPKRNFILFTHATFLLVDQIANQCRIFHSQWSHSDLWRGYLPSVISFIAANSMSLGFYMSDSSPIISEKGHKCESNKDTLLLRNAKEFGGISF